MAPGRRLCTDAKMILYGTKSPQPLMSVLHLPAAPHKPLYFTDTIDTGCEKRRVNLEVMYSHALG